MRHPVLLFVLLLLFPAINGYSADPPPVRGLCIAAPCKEGLKDFLRFMKKIRGPRKQDPWGA